MILPKLKTLKLLLVLTGTVLTIQQATAGKRAKAREEPLPSNPPAADTGLIIEPIIEPILEPAIKPGGGSVAEPGSRSNPEHQGESPPSRILTVSSGGNFEIGPLDSESGQVPLPHTLKIAKPDTNGFYCLSYQRPAGFEQPGLPGRPGNYIYLAMLNVQLCNSDNQVIRNLATLTDGGSYTDSINNVSITQLSHAADRVTVHVSMGTTCDSRPPSLGIIPVSQNENAGGTLNFTFNLTNNDSTGCPGSSFILLPSLPQSWSGRVSPASFSLAPGQTVSANLSVTAPMSTPDGSYPVGVSLSDPANPSHLAQAGGTFIVSDCVRATPLLSLSPASQSEIAGSPLTFNLALTNKDSRTCPDSNFVLSTVLPGSWTGSISKNTLTLSPGARGNAILKVISPRDAAPKNYPVQLQASDGASPLHSVSAEAAYQVLDISGMAGIGDLDPPTPPPGLSGRSLPKQIELTWDASKDNTGVVNYSIWRDHVKIATTTSTNFLDYTAARGTTYTYVITATDAAGNASARSAPLKITKK
jgi:hypothetical protein